jgi:NCS1 family nucleobase:cation symporter-1
MTTITPPVPATHPTHPDIVELQSDLSHSPYYSHDMAPIPASGRKWGTASIAALWISMAACVTTYTLASSLIDGGMNWWQAVLTIFLANTIVLIPMILNAHAGTRYGIPFPVYCRASFGINGANLPALLRALVACGWFGIQCWIGGAAIYAILAVLFPAVANSHILSILVPAIPASPTAAAIPAVTFNIAQLACFLFFWLINMAVVYAGIDSIRILLNIKAPLLIALGLILLAWAWNAAGGFGPMLTQPSDFVEGGKKAGQFWLFFFPALTGAVGYWATLSLNIPDFSRYAYSQKSQAVGQALGLPTTMALYSFIGVAVTSATIVIYGKKIWDPIALCTTFKNPVALIIAMLALALATLATNIAANVVSPANDFAHLWPKKISFRTGGLITGVIGIFMQPWKLYADPSGYIFTWLIAYSSLLGAIGGILIADYFLIRKTHLNLPALYEKNSEYWYTAGFNPKAIIAFTLAIAPCLPGFLNTIGLTHFPTIWTQLYHYAWFLSFGIALIVYALLMMSTSRNVKTEPVA